MAQQTVITVTHGSESVGTIQAAMLKPVSNPKGELNSVINWLAGALGGDKQMSIDVQVNGGASTAASGTLTFSSAGTAGDTFTINGVTFTAVASGATNDQWVVGASASASASAAASAINASTSPLISGYVTASASSGVITITASQKGIPGNCITISGGQADITASGARLTGGTNTTPNVYHFGV